MEREAYRALCSRATLQNKKEGCFLDIVATVAPRVDLARLSRATSDLDRVRLCANSCWDSIGAELVFRGKDAEEGLRRRKDGNEAFERGDLEQALLAYSQSAMRTPQGHDLALVLANRSALLFRMKEWALCVEDVRMALQLNYPRDKRHKLHERLATAHLHLGNFQEAKVNSDLALALANTHNAHDDNFLNKLRKLREVIEKGSPAPAPIKDEQGSRPLEKSRVFPSASAHFGVAWSAEEGRSATAVADILAGDEVLAETPFAACLLPERSGTHCHHCFRSLRAPVPCELCAQVAFCSKACRGEARTYHQHECRVLLLLIGSGMSILPLLALRIITQQPLKQVLQEAASLGEPCEAVVLDESGAYVGGYGAVYHLSGHEKEREPLDFLQRTVMALFLLKCLRLVGFSEVNLLRHPQPTEEELLLGSLLLRNLQLLQFNAYEITHTLRTQHDSPSTWRSVQLGLGIYATAAFFNHSCAPNVGRYFRGRSLHVVATRRIGMGEALTDNYGALFRETPKERRQWALEGRYWFSCACVACSGDEALWCLRPDTPLPLPALQKALALWEAGDTDGGKELLLRLLNAAEASPGKDHFLAEEALRRILANQ